ncbi:MULTISPECIES: SCO4983 family protein [unclassified Streptomyces]|uniref:SCO4983 family protein n=1 Tax=unclassified Streptomyces TaxID=2593676 RepID=UPI0022B62B3F|nr:MULTISPECIES: hypothetical protein [unclassified Streptomyces]MCZ7416803.1 hypothetical protein [Streptomyces sp. WMMC897]MCZ7433387.1 hypothetical protein [Streptomyces sp. WMMC1477]
MYEPSRAHRGTSVHSVTEQDAAADGYPHRSREEELDIRLAGHLTALLTVTDELRVLAPSPELDTAAHRLATQVARLRGAPPQRADPTSKRAEAEHVEALHRRAHTLAGNALVVATAREDVPGEALAAARMEAHAEALGL